jgi:chloramphenicol 3-O-phosphotransferase
MFYFPPGEIKSSVRTFVSKVEIKKVRFFNHILLSCSKVCCALLFWLVGFEWVDSVKEKKRREKRVRETTSFFLFNLIAQL